MRVKIQTLNSKLGFNNRRMCVILLSMFLLTFMYDTGLAKQDLSMLNNYSQRFANLGDQYINVVKAGNDSYLVSINVKEMSLDEALKNLTGQISVGLSYSSEVDLSKKVSLNTYRTDFFEVLNQLLYSSNLEYLVSHNRDVLVIRDKEEENVLANEVQNRIFGTVRDSQTGEPLPGVNIIIQGTSTGTSTNVDGEFNLNVEDLGITLLVSYIGYVQKQVEVANRTNIDITLESAIISGDELVVVGYGSQRRSDLTGSISSIGRKELTEVPVYSMENALQGRAAGVEVRADGYRPGEGSTIRIRGTRSFVASNEPLIVLDGIPIDGGLMDLIPNDVESVEILKDASATAIYGSRGANGVILISTRRGQEGLMVDYSGYTGLQYTFDRINVMDTSTLAEFERDNARYHGTYTGNDSDIFESWQIDAIQENRTTDWQDLVFDRGIQQSHNLSFRGGSNGSIYSISGTFNDHQAVVRNNDFRRHSIRANFDQNFNSWLKAGFSAGLTNSTQHRSVSFSRVVTNSPMSSPFDNEGNPLMFDERGDRNPLFDMQRENSIDRRNRTRFLGTFYTEMELLPERLQLRMNLAPDFTFRNDGYYSRDEISEAGTRSDRSTSVLFEALLNYNETLFQNHYLNVTSLFSIQNFEGTATRLDVLGLPYERQLYHNLGSAENVDNRSSSLSEWTLESYMMRLNYNYDDRYLLTFTGRVDGSSRLAAGNEYGLFPSMAFAWQLGNERIFREFDRLSELKLRFSIGDVGNTAIQPYQTQGALQERVVSFGDGDHFAFEHGDIPNPDLRWERTRTIDLGLDFAFLEDRIRGSVGVYQSNTRDLILERQLPITSGYSSILENVGETRNRGFELGLSSINVHTGNFMWSTDLNFSTNQNEIVELFGGQNDDPGNGWFIGESVNAHYDFKVIGIWQQDEAEEAAGFGAVPGDLRFFDANGDGSISGDDRVILGTPDPKWTTGITNRLSYKSVDFSVFVYAAQGMLSRAGIGSGGPSGLLSFRNERGNLLDVNYWMPDSPSNTYPRPRNEAQVYRDALAYMNTSYVRVRNVTLGYNMPVELTNRIGARSMRVYLSGHNLFTFTPFQGYDPEGATGLDMPNYQTFLLGIDLSF